MKARTRLILDMVIACGLIAAYRPTWTGISLHQWLSVAVIAPILVHLVVNWEWVLRVASTFLKRLFSASRLNFAVDAALFIASVTVTVSGIMVSPLMPFFGVHLEQSVLWPLVHSWSANAMILLFAAHALLHRRWILSTMKRLAPAPSQGAGSAAAVVMASTRPSTARPTGLSRRSGRERAARAAAQRSTARRAASVVGVSCFLGAIVVASVGLAGPALSKPLEPQNAATSSRSADRTAPHDKAKSTRVASARQPAPATRTNAPAPTPKPKAALLTCPVSGCTAASCHGTHGQSASVYYKTH